MTGEDGDGERRRYRHGMDSTPFRRDRIGPEKLRRGEEEYEPSLPRDGGLKSVVREMQRLAEEYEDEGWAVVQCHPGGVETLAETAGLAGIEIIVPDNELEAVEEQLSEGSFESYQVYRDEYERLLFFVVAVEDTDNQTALLFCGYFDLDEAAPMYDRAGQDGELAVYLRTGGGDYVEFAPVDPAHFRPDDPAEPPSDDGTPTAD
jgi:hypothetical protein